MKTLNDEFIPYEQALALKELGFDEPCFGYYQQEWHDDGMTELEPSLQMVISKQHQHAYQIYTAPLYQQCWRWFREKYGLYSWVTMELGATLTFCWTITGENKGTEYKAFLKTHEEAELECLKKLIEIVKNE